MMDITIRAAAEQAGCTPRELRIWGERYGWPLPRRNRTGSRLFDPVLVGLLRQVVVERNRGTPIGQILGTGSPIIPRRSEDIQPRTFVAVDLAGIAEPQREDGRDLRHAILVSLGKGAAAADLRHLAEARLSRVHPADRPAILALVERIEQTPGAQ